MIDSDLDVIKYLQGVGIRSDESLKNFVPPETVSFRFRSPETESVPTFAVSVLRLGSNEGGGLHGPIMLQRFWTPTTRVSASHFLDHGRHGHGRGKIFENRFLQIGRKALGHLFQREAAPVDSIHDVPSGALLAQSKVPRGIGSPPPQVKNATSIFGSNDLLTKWTTPSQASARKPPGCCPSRPSMGFSATYT